MGNSLSLHDPVKSLQRDLVELLRKAAAEVTDSATPLAVRIHELRKRLKRARAWAQILPRPLARSADKSLRNIHRRLGERRDFDATLEAIARLLVNARSHHRDNAAAGLVLLREQMHRAADRQQIDNPAEARMASTLHNTCGDILSLAQLIDAAAIDGDFSLLAESAAATTRRSRNAMKVAIKSGKASDYHHWRKWMKYHWFHLRYLAPLWPELLRVEATAAEHTAEWLGQSQDIELVRNAVAAATETGSAGDDAVLSASQRQTITGLLDREQQRLLRQAASVGLHLHAETPQAFKKRLNNYGKARRYRG